MTVIVSEFAPSDTERTTTQVLALLPAPHPGASKLGAAANDSAPLFATTLNKSWSTDAALAPTATTEYVRVAVPSASVAPYVATAVSPSATLAEAVAPAENSGVASLTSVMEIATVSTSAVPVESAAMIVRV